MLNSKRGMAVPMEFTRDPPSHLSFASLSANIYKTSFKDTLEEMKDRGGNIVSSITTSSNPCSSITENNTAVPQLLISSPATSSKEVTVIDSITKEAKREHFHGLHNEKERDDDASFPKVLLPDRIIPGNSNDSSSYSVPLSHHLLLPYIISGYLQLFFNCFLVTLVLYITIQFMKTVRRDVELKVEEYKSIILSEIAQCSKHYLDNRCHPDERVPAMDKACNTWQVCMNRDPTEISWTKISAETIAEIINGFVEPISYKTMIFFVLFTFGLLFVSNLAFGFAKTRTRPFIDGPSSRHFIRS
jgi:hypothetical protein